MLTDSPEFERFRPYFADPDGWSDDDPAIGALCDEVQARGDFTLRDLQTGHVHPQRGDYVWFRIG